VTTNEVHTFLNVPLPARGPALAGPTSDARDPEAIPGAGHAAPVDRPAGLATSIAAARPGAAAGGRTPAAATSPADLLAGLGRRFRGPTLRMRFELRTSIARQIFRRDFVYVSQQLHALEASRRVQGLPREDLNEALAAVGRRIDAVRTLLLHSAEQTRDLIALHGHSSADVEFARPTELHATIVSPYARDFMDVLVHADVALGELERAWLLGLIEPTEKGRLAGECRKAVQGVKEMVRHQRQLIGTQVRELNAHRGDEAAPAGIGEGRSPPARAVPETETAGDDEALLSPSDLADLAGELELDEAANTAETIDILRAFAPFEASNRDDPSPAGPRDA
jgi:hypothetical protein